MQSSLDNVVGVILAAGKGTRIGQALPKAVYPLAGKPMIHYTIDTLKRIPIADINLVVGYRATDVKASIGTSVKYVHQEQQLGTAHALQQALEVLHPSAAAILVMNCDDSAFYEASTIRKFIEFHKRNTGPVSIISASAADPTGLGRIVRDQAGQIQGIVEQKDATPEEQAIKEINTGCYIFDSSWIKENIAEIAKSKSGEYYLTDAIALALEQSFAVNVFQLQSSGEWMPVNTPAELDKANRLMLKKLARKHTPTVTLIDIDNTILDTESLKQDIPALIAKKLKRSANIELSPDQVAQEYQEIYQTSKEELGYVNVPSVAIKLAKHFKVKSPTPIKDVLYSLQFANYIKPDTISLLEHTNRWSKTFLFGDGDLIYEPVKCNALQLGEYYNDVFFSETKQELVEDLVTVFAGYHVIVIDDQIQALEAFAQAGANCTLIHLKVGPYSSQEPKDNDFTPSYQAQSLAEVLEYLQNVIHVWT